MDQERQAQAKTLEREQKPTQKLARALGMAEAPEPARDLMADHRQALRTFPALRIFRGVCR